MTPRHGDNCLVNVCGPGFERVRTAAFSLFDWRKVTRRTERLHKGHRGVFLFPVYFVVLHVLRAPLRNWNNLTASSGCCRNLVFYG